MNKLSPDIMFKQQTENTGWPLRPDVFGELLSPVEAAQYLRLDQTGHSPKSACRTLNYWRNRDELKATKYAKHIWFLRKELEEFLKRKTLK
jgi:hypothetical protein